MGNRQTHTPQQKSLKYLYFEKINQSLQAHKIVENRQIPKICLEYESSD